MDQEEWTAIIEQGMLHRGWISNSYAQIEFLLGDLIVRCRDFPEYADQTQAVSHSAAKRVKKVRKIIEIDGPMSPFAGKLSRVLEGFTANDELRNLLAHGFCTFLHTPDNDAGFQFRRFERPHPDGEDDYRLTERTLRLIDLQYHREQLVHEASNALDVFRKIHAELGWGEF